MRRRQSLRTPLWSNFMDQAFSAGCALAVTLATWSPAAAQPSFVVIVDTSASMTELTGTGTNTCAQIGTRLSDAKCALARVVNERPEISFGLARFAGQCSGACDSTTCGGACGCNCTQTCTDTLSSGEILVPIATDNQEDITRWIDFSCQDCEAPGFPIATGTDPELQAFGESPLAGALLQVQHYYTGGHLSFGSPMEGDALAACRPPAVILLADGPESCGGDTATAIRALRTTSFSGTDYDIRTYVIGLGVTPGDPGIENMATEGGTDAPGAHRGFYATIEASLDHAFDQIINDQLRRSDQSVVDGDCDGIDDDCDGVVDEGGPIAGSPPTVCASCIPSSEVCDGIDNDCNGIVDDGLSLFCGVCEPALQHCQTVGGNICVDDGDCIGGSTCRGLTCRFDPGGSATPQTGALGECRAIDDGLAPRAPITETCNDVDDDCDGIVDNRPCPTGTDVGACVIGNQLCAGGDWEVDVGGDPICRDAITPIDELCNNVDDDCDGIPDNDSSGGMTGACGVSGLATTPPAICRAGDLVCTEGSLVCMDAIGPETETCDALDNDCDGNVDEEQPPGEACGASDACVLGSIQCVDGREVCVGEVPSLPEACDCEDNDCDGTIDETGDGAICPATAACIECSCAPPCSVSESPRCPPDRMAHETADGCFCVEQRCDADACAAMTVAVAGEAVCAPDTEALPDCRCVAGRCTFPCDGVVCTGPLVCQPETGACADGSPPVDAGVEGDGGRPHFDAGVEDAGVEPDGSRPGADTSRPSTMVDAADESPPSGSGCASGAPHALRAGWSMWAMFALVLLWRRFTY